jgi:ABC-type transporter MlaC component
MRTRISTTSKTKSEVAALCAALVACLGAGAALAATDAAPPDSAKVLIEKTVAQGSGCCAMIPARSHSSASSSRRSPTSRFDFRTMARLVLARDWKRLDAAKRDEFVDQFTTYLAKRLRQSDRAATSRRT